jgi:hypothetical protein
MAGEGSIAWSGATLPFRQAVSGATPLSVLIDREPASSREQAG